MLEMKCKQCGETVTAKDEKALITAVKAHFKKQHPFLPVTDERIEAAVKQDAKPVK